MGKTRLPQRAAVEAGRVQDVLVARLNGASLHDLRAFAEEKGWGKIGDAELIRLADSADDLLVESLDRDRVKVLARHVASLRTLYARALQDGDHRTALAVLKTEADLYRLNRCPVPLDVQEQPEWE
jgi:hypothetical protein